MKTKNEIIADLVPALAQGLLASTADPHCSGYTPAELADRAFVFAEVMHAEGVKRGVYPKDESAPAQVPGEQGG